MSFEKFANPSSRAARAQTLGRAVQRLTRGALDKRGFVDAAIVTEWPAIAGELIGRHSLPERIIFPRDRSQAGILHLKLGLGALATEIQHFEPVLLERINRYFGFRAVGSIKIIHGPLPPEVTRPVRELPPIDEDIRARIQQGLEDVGDEELKQALDRLGSSVARRRALPVRG